MQKILKKTLGRGSDDQKGFTLIELLVVFGISVALAAGIVQQVAGLESVLPSAVERAQSLARLAANRKNFQWMKEHIYGENAATNGVHGPAHVSRHPSGYAPTP